MLITESPVNSIIEMVVGKRSINSLESLNGCKLQQPEVCYLIVNIPNERRKKLRYTICGGDKRLSCECPLKTSQLNGNRVEKAKL